jgi:membrane-bound serine protease (ClpP class)
MVYKEAFYAARRCTVWVLAFLASFFIFSFQHAASVETQEITTGNAGFVEVFEVNGLLDEVLADVLIEVIEEAQLNGTRALILQVNSKQAVISDDKLNEIAKQVSESSVPIDVWVGPSGSAAHGKVAQLISVADSIGVSIGSTLGDTGTQVLNADLFGQVWGENHQLLIDTRLNWQQAISRGIVRCEKVEVDELGNSLSENEQLARCANPTLGDFLVSRDSFISEVVTTDQGPRLSPLTQTKIRGLSLLDQLMHTVASPPVAYLLLISGLVLLLFEFFSIGVGIAGAIGAIVVALGSYGLAALPIRPWALIIILVSMVAFGVDMQTVVPRLWTFIGQIMFTLGTIFLYPEGSVQMSWIPMVVCIAGISILVFRGMPIMIRGRFATTEIKSRLEKE